ncbi:MAG TPA: histidine phosphatase family protein [Vicinamibacterales bacterium]|nr:histidine phosphatase family protein [Vicinamibacterales bacterium]
MLTLRRIFLAIAMLGAAAATCAAQATVIVVRHAERADSAGRGQLMMATDPDLSDAGRTRAASLASLLRDAGVTAIYATEFKRTQQTAAPLSEAIGIPVTTVASGDSAALLAKLKASSGIVLVVGHSNTVPQILKGLGIRDAPAIADTEYDNLFIVTTGEAPRVLRLRY